MVPDDDARSLGGEVSDRQWRDVTGILAVQVDRLDIATLRAVAADLGITELLDRAKAVVATAIAVESQEAVGQHAALEIGPYLTLDEAGDGCALLACAREEGLEVLSDDFVKQRLLGPVPVVLDGEGSAGPNRFRATSVPRPTAMSELAHGAQARATTV